MTDKQRTLHQFRQELGARLVEEGIEFRWPADETIGVEVEDKNTEKAAQLMQTILDAWGSK